MSTESKQNNNKLSDKEKQLKRKVIGNRAIAFTMIVVTAATVLGGLAVSITNQEDGLTVAERRKQKQQAEYGEEIIDTLLKTLATDFTYDVGIHAKSSVKKHEHEDGKVFIGEEHVETAGHMHEGVLYYGSEHAESELPYDGNSPIEYELDTDVYEYDILDYHSKGVNTDSVKLEYIENGDKKLINNVDVNGIQYINDGLMYSEDEYIDIGIGINRTDYIRGLWYNIIGTGVNYGFEIEKQKNGNETIYSLNSSDVSSIMDIFGYTMYYDEIGREVDATIKVKDGIIYNVEIVLDVDRAYSVESHKQEINVTGELTDFKLEDYNLSLDENGKPSYIETAGTLSQAPLQIEGVPIGAGSTQIITNNGNIMVSSELSEDFLEQVKEDTVKYDDTLSYVYVEFNSEESIVLLFNHTNNTIVGYKYYGGHIMYDYNSALPYDFIDKYRIANGFTGENGSRDILEYRGRVGNKPYTIAINMDGEYPKSIEIMPDEYYKSIDALVKENIKSSVENSTGTQYNK